MWVGLLWYWEECGVLFRRYAYRDLEKEHHTGWDVNKKTRSRKKRWRRRRRRRRRRKRRRRRRKSRF